MPERLANSVGTVLLLLGAAPAAGGDLLRPTDPLVPPPGGDMRGVAIADVNADSRPDIVVVLEYDDGDGRVQVWLGRGDGTFFSNLTYPVGDRPTAVGVADFNADGAPDIVTANGDLDLSFLPGLGDGSFPTHTRIRLDYHQRALAIADFNNDGAPDVGLSQLSGDQVMLLINVGGQLVPQPPIASFNNPGDIIAADFDADSRIDLAVVNRFDDEIVTLLGAGDGSFAPPISTPIGNTPSSLSGMASTDVDMDGLSDLLVADGSADEVAILVSDGAGSFVEVGVLPGTPDALRWLAAEDFDRDGVPDVIVGGFETHVYLGSGDGGFTQTGQPVESGGPMAIGDLDLDGDPDLVFARARAATVLLNTTFERCSPADLAEPDGELDFSDVLEFLTAFASMSPRADLAVPFGQLDFIDALVFLSEFGAGCP